MSRTITYRFGPFRLDPAGRQFWRAGTEVELPLKVFDCIVYLVENRNRAVGRDELISAVWGDVNVSDSVLSQTLLLARRVFDDSGQSQRYIKTVRGFGYRWSVPVEVSTETEQQQTPDSDSAAGIRRLRPAVMRYVALAVLILGLLTAVLLAMRQGMDSPADGTTPPVVEGRLVMLLPVAVTANAEHAWVRLGLMDLVAERLRAAGQAVVPGDTVIALLRGDAGDVTAAALNTVTAATGADLVFAIEARSAGTLWTVALHSVHGANPPLMTAGEGHELMDAARAATDRMVLLLGAIPADEPGMPAGLQLLLQQVRSARLHQQMDLARALIEQAEPGLRAHPEMRFQLASVEVHSHALVTAQALLESLLEDLPGDLRPELRARTLNALATIHGRRGDWDIAEPLLLQALALAGGPEPTLTLGLIRTNLGAAALERGDTEGARTRIAAARSIFQSVGDVRNLGTVDLFLGVLEARRHHYAEALHYFESAAGRYAAVRDTGGELHAQAYVMSSNLALLDLPAAAAVEPRVVELAAASASSMLAVIANLVRADLLLASGRHGAAKSLLAEVLDILEARPDESAQRPQALVKVAEQGWREADAALAVTAAGEAVDRLLAHPVQRFEEPLARAWLVLVRSQLALDAPAAADTAAVNLSELADAGGGLSSRVYAALAQAELAAAAGRQADADDAFEQALAAADAGRVPELLLDVVQSYVGWLLQRQHEQPVEPVRILSVLDHVARHADYHYDVALLQLQYYHALGPPSAWRSALQRATALAGERRIPPELTTAPCPAAGGGLPSACAHSGGLSKN